MIQAICTLHLPFVDPRFNKMMPNSPRDTASLPQNATLHSALLPKINRKTQAHLMHHELFVLGGKGNLFAVEQSVCREPR